MNIRHHADGKLDTGWGEPRTLYKPKDRWGESMHKSRHSHNKSCHAMLPAKRVRDVGTTLRPQLSVPHWNGHRPCKPFPPSSLATLKVPMMIL